MACSVALRAWAGSVACRIPIVQFVIKRDDYGDISVSQ
jgi:hypothetical protein